MFCPKCGSEDIEPLMDFGSACCMCCGQVVNDRDLHDEIIEGTEVVRSMSEALKLREKWCKKRGA